MAFTNDSVSVRYSMASIDTLRHESVMLPLCNRRWEQEMIDSGEVKIPVYRSLYEPDGRKKDGSELTGNDAVSVRDYDQTSANAAKWAAAGDDGLTFLSLKPNQQMAKSWFTPQAAIDQVPGDPVMQAGTTIGYQMAHELDQRLYAAFQAGAGTVGAANTFGNTTNYLDDDGVAHGSGISNVTIGEFLWGAIKRFSLKATKQGFGMDSPMPYMKFMITNEQVFNQWEEWAFDKNLNSAGTFNLDVLQGLFSRAGLSMTERIVRNTAWIISNEIPEVTISSKKHHSVIFGTTRAFAYGQQNMLSRALDAAENQTGDGTTAGRDLIGSRVESWFSYGTLMTDDRQVMTAAVRKEA